MTETATQLLDAAQGMIQDRGFNAFSYRDLSDEVGIKTASIHYHFRNKADLAEALMSRYLEQLREALADFDQRHAKPAQRLRAFFDLYQKTADSSQICLCGALASDLASLREDVQERIAEYFEVSEGWLTKTLTAAKRMGPAHFEGRAADQAATVMAALQGALLMNRGRPDAAAVERVRKAMSKTLGI